MSRQQHALDSVHTPPQISSMILEIQLQIYAERANAAPVRVRRKDIN